MMLHTYSPQPMSLPSMNFLHLTVSEIQPGQTISRRPPTHPDTMGENNTPTALKGCGVKSPYFISYIIYFELRATKDFNILKILEVVLRHS